MRFKLPSFTLTTREPTAEELRVQSDRHQREYIAVEIAKRNGRGRKADAITLVVGLPIIRIAGDETPEDLAAARSAISFASAPWCADDPHEKEWMETHGEDLSNEAFCHRTLGKELRQ
jgi:hypothetical protein